MSNEATATKQQLWQRWATARPWRVQGWDNTPGDRGCYILGGGPENSTGEHMVGAALPLPITNRAECEANAELIVTAVNEHDALLAEAGRLREALKRIEECAHGIMPIYRDMDHLRGIVIGLNDARWTRLYAILGEARAALSGKGTT
jgi:hypothetical protein